MIYLDASTVLAELFAENVRPPKELWDERLVSSRLLAYEVWNRTNLRPPDGPAKAAAAELLERVQLIAMTDAALSRASAPFPVAVRTLDRLHLATVDFLIRQGRNVRVASYDKRMLAAAEALEIPIYGL